MNKIVNLVFMYLSADDDAAIAAACVHLPHTVKYVIIPIIKIIMYFIAKAILRTVHYLH